MTIDDLRTILTNLMPGNMAEISYGTYEEFFPPGEPDEPARERCFNFARKQGCRIENLPAQNTVRFIKDA